MLFVSDYCYTFPVIRGVQAGREYYVTMCPLHLIPRLFKFDEEDVPAELRAQRMLNKSRVPTIKAYIRNNYDNYVFSSICASIDGVVEFKPLGNGSLEERIGSLKIPMDARFLINDGQHRRAAIEEAIREDPKLGHETISVVFFIDKGLKRTQQMFSDLNRYAVRPTHSLAILYDHRDPIARLVDRLTKEVLVFNGMTETSKSTISNRSRKLFTLSSIYNATCKLIGKKDGEEIGPMDENFVRDFWEKVSLQIPDWLDAVNIVLRCESRS
jgi:DNA sulfur modification protein DndB